MDNEQFDDIAILKTLSQLKTNGLLHSDDAQELLNRLKTPWGQQAGKDLMSESAAFEEPKSILRRFASV